MLPLLLLIQIVRDLHVLFQDLHFLLVHLPLLNLLVLSRVLGAQMFSLPFDGEVSCSIHAVSLERFRSLSVLFEEGIGPVFLVRSSVFYALRSCDPFLLLLGMPILLFLKFSFLPFGQFLLPHTEVVNE